MRRTDLPPEIQRRASRIRGAGYAIAGGSVLFIAYCLVASVLAGLSAGTARDPFTGASVEHLDAACDDWAAGLLTVEPDDTDEARRAAYEVSVSAWRWRCQHVDAEPARELLAREPRLKF